MLSDIANPPVTPDEPEEPTLEQSALLEPTLCAFCGEWMPAEHVCVKPEDREELEPGQAPQVVTRPGD
jgi:hypothetical protein